MKVKDFIKELENMPQDAELFVKDEFGWFYPANIIQEDAVFEKHYNILGTSQRFEGIKFKKEKNNEH